MEKSLITLWDYWIDHKLMMAYCIGEKNGILNFSEAPVQKLYYEDNDSGESWKKGR